MGENITKEEFEIFKDAVYEDDLLLQIEAIKKIKFLAKGLGEKSTREDLLPLLESSLNLHEEVLLNLCQQLQDFVPLVGGLEYSRVIFDILTKLSQTDENFIREAAVDAIIHIGKEFTNEQVHELIVPVLKELSPDGWFPFKCSAVMLYPVFYPKLDEENKADVRHNFKIFIQDDSSIVRTCAAKTFSDFIGVVEDLYVKEDFIPMFCDMVLDPLEPIKCISIDIAVSLAKRLNESALDPSIFKSIESASDYPSWRVKQEVASKIADFQKNLPYGTYRGKILALFQKLSEDLENTIRCQIARNIFDYCKYLLESYISHPHQENNFEHIFEQSIVPVIRKLARDECDDVRLALSSNVLNICPLLSEECFNKAIIPLLQEVLTQDESIGILANYLQGVCLISSRGDQKKNLDAIITCIKVVLGRSQANWRSRRAILTTFVDLSKFCTSDFFSDKFNIYFATLLGDQVFAIRRSATLIVPVLAKQYGIKWATEKLVPYFISFYQDRKYLYRFVPIFGISEMIKPFLSNTPVSFLEDFKKILEDKENANHEKALLSLVRIVRTLKAIENELDTEDHSKYLKLREELNYLSSSDTKIYSETNFSDLKEKFKDLNVYSVEESDFQGDHCPYLEGLLLLIYKKFLPVLKTLCKDATNNVAIRAVDTLGEIDEVIAKISKETKGSWVDESLKQLNSDEVLNIDKELKTEQKTTTESLEKIDTTLVEDVDVQVDLSKTICIENSNIVENITKTNVNDNDENVGKTVDKENEKSTDRTDVKENEEQSFELSDIKEEDGKASPTAEVPKQDMNKDMPIVVPVL